MAERVPTNSSFVNFAEAPPRLHRKIELVSSNLATMLAVDRNGGNVKMRHAEYDTLTLDDFLDLGKGRHRGSPKGSREEHGEATQLKGGLTGISD